MRMELTIRPARAGDYDDLCRLFEAVDSHHRAAHPEIFQKPEGPARDWAFVRELLESAECGFFVAELEGRVIGFVTVLLERSPDAPIFKPRRYAVIDNLVVDHRIAAAGRGADAGRKGRSLGAG